MQLVAYGAQDIYLTGQPQITFFKSVYRRHTNFATESILQTINGTANPGNRVSVTISRNGDLLKNLWVQFQPQNFVAASASAFTLSSDFGHALFDYLELEIGGQLIDRQYGRWLTIWRDLTEVNPTGAQGQLGTSAAEPAINSTTGTASEATAQGFSTKYQRMAYTHQAPFGASSEPQTSMASAPTEAYVPMRFWFCRNPGLAIPLIALQYHEVKFNINFQTAANLFPLSLTPPANSTVPSNSQLPGYSTIQVYADYVYLDTTERRQFAQNAHEYLIDQLQWQNDSSGNSTIRLNFNHPVKELVWTGSPNYNNNNSALAGSDYYDNVQGAATPSQIVQGDNSTTSAALVGTQCKIVLNGTDRFTYRNLKYFTRNQIWDCHTGFGATGIADSIAVYSFALRPEEHQPSGTCNFSRIDTAQLQFLYAQGESTASIDIYAVNYNVLRIMSGMGGLAYTN
jgi:hypothetical protein